MAPVTSPPFRISATRSRILGVLSFLPAGYMVLFIGSIMSSIASRTPGFMHEAFPMWMTVHLGVMIVTYALIGYYIYLAVKRRLSGGAVAAWSVALFMGNMLVFPFAWYFLGRERPAASYLEWREHAHGTESVGC